MSGFRFDFCFHAISCLIAVRSIAIPPVDVWIERVERGYSLNGAESKRKREETHESRSKNVRKLTNTLIVMAILVVVVAKQNLLGNKAGDKSSVTSFP
jgi:hypothetical protein